MFSRIQRIVTPTPVHDLDRLRFDRAELAGALADLGVLVPIAIALIVNNRLSATATLLPAGLLYIAAGLFYRVPVPVQPLKAFGIIAIAQGFGPDHIAAGALVMGVVFLILGMTGWLDQVARVFPHPIIRGVQFSVGLLFCKLAWGLTLHAPVVFADHLYRSSWLVAGALAVAVVAFAMRKHQITLLFIAGACIAMAVRYNGHLEFGPAAVHIPTLSPDTLATAAVALVVPQLPLTFANSCLATADVARTYFGGSARRVTPGRLAISLGLANIVAGGLSGMPVCHGAGGMTAHRSFGARNGAAPIMIGTILLMLAIGLGASLAPLFAGFPLPILAGLLITAGILHILLLKDLRAPFDWMIALAVGLVGFWVNLAVALVAALVVWWAGKGIAGLRARRA